MSSDVKQWFGVVTLFPEMFKALNSGIPGRALEKGIVEWQCWNPRDFTKDNHRTVDDRPYGGGPGMVMMAEPLAAAIHGAKEQRSQAKVIYLSPQGQPLTQASLGDMAKGSQEMILVCGRYEGIDQRFIEQHVDEVWSLGDYVLSGGEIAAMALMDGVIRLLPGSLGHEESAQQDSFMQGLLDHPHYTRPETYKGQAVPKVLLSGDHAAIARWRLQQALGRTWLLRRDLLDKLELDDQQQALLNEFIDEHSS